MTDVITLTDLAAVKPAVKGAADLVVKLVGDFTLADRNTLLSGLGNTGPVTLDLTKAILRGPAILNANRELTVKNGRFMGARVRVNDAAGVTLDGATLDMGLAGEGGKGLTLRRIRSGGMLSLGVSTRNNPVRGLLIEDFALLGVGNDGIKLGAPQDVTIRRGFIAGQWPTTGQHIDAIQALLGSEPSCNIAVEGLTIITAGMGINFSSRLDIPYVDVRVTGNEIRTASTNAIALGAAVRPVIRDNRIHTLPGAPVSPRIYRGAAWTDGERAGNSVDGRLIEAA